MKTNPISSVYSIPQPQPKLVDSSLLRKIRHIVLTIFHDLWVTLAHRRCILPVNSNPELQACSQLKQTRTLTASTISEYGQLLADKSDIQWVTAGLSLLGNQDLPAVQHNKRFLAIPLVLKGRFENHIVAIYLDRESNRLEYYDSKGLTIQDRDNSQLNDFLRKVLEKYGNAATTVIENTEKHQWDSHNCGVYVSDYFFRRKRGQLPESIFQHGRDIKDIYQVRVRMIKELEVDYSQKVQDARAKLSAVPAG